MTWNGTDKEVGPFMNLTSTNNATVTLTANWTPTTFKVVYDKNDGAAANGEQEETLIFDNAWTLFNNNLSGQAKYTRTGYNLVGWDWTVETGSQTAELGGRIDASQVNAMYKAMKEANASKFVIYAKWEAIPYAITYNLAGGDVAEGVNPSSYTIESNTFTLENPTREGYSFAGWEGTDIEGKVDSVTIEKGSIGNRSFTATWTIRQYKITYKFDTLAIESEEYDFNSKVNLAVNDQVTSFSKTGFTFSGWDIEGTTYAEGAELPEGWNTDWASSYKGTIIYAQ